MLFTCGMIMFIDLFVAASPFRQHRIFSFLYIFFKIHFLYPFEYSLIIVEIKSLTNDLYVIRPPAFDRTFFSA